MILVDSSVWIDYFRGAANPETDRLDALLGTERVLIGDLMLTEVLQRFTTDRAFSQTLELLGTVETVEIGGREVAIEAARNFRVLRSRGVTVRKTIDTLIATRCLAQDRQGSGERRRRRSPCPALRQSPSLVPYAGPFDASTRRPSRRRRPVSCASTTTSTR